MWEGGGGRTAVAKQLKDTLRAARKDVVSLCLESALQNTGYFLHAIRGH